MYWGLICSEKIEFKKTNDNFANMTTYEQKQMTSPFDYGFPKLWIEPPKKTLTDYLKNSSEREHFEDLKYFDMEISENFAGMFIGKNGRNIRNIRNKYSSKILISNENGKRYIYVSHSPDTFKVIGEIIYAQN
jgi:predicted RNA-binding protein YlqC (UPF0109 family)